MVNKKDSNKSRKNKDKYREYHKYKKEILKLDKIKIDVENALKTIKLNRFPRYRPNKHPKQLFLLLASGLTLEAAAVKLGITKTMISEWVEKDDRMEKAKEMGMLAKQAFWEQVGLYGTTGDLPNYKPAYHRQFMASNFKKYRQNQPINNLTVIQQNMASLPDKVLKEKIFYEMKSLEAKNQLPDEIKKLSDKLFNKKSGQ